jgi:hypothetical protein
MADRGDAAKSGVDGDVLDPAFTKFARQKISIRVSRWNAGCLNPMLRMTLADLETRVRAMGDTMSAEQMENYRRLSLQIEGCVAAVEEAEHRISKARARGRK